MTATIVKPRTDTAPRTDDGHDDVAHYIRKRDQMRGYVNGEPVTALCGKTWVPSRDPEGRPMCEACREEHARLCGPGYDG